MPPQQVGVCHPKQLTLAETTLQEVTVLTPSTLLLRLLLVL
jgi:hypothetical protein